jgi:photosystem II stability/assembly factor-like uncharacterized protein
MFSKLIFLLTIIPLTALAQWTKVPFPENDFFQFTTLVYTDDSLLFACNGNRLFRSIDDGNTWTNLSDSLPGVATGFARSGEYLLTSVYDPFWIVPGGIYHSTDNGNRWQKLVGEKTDVSYSSFFVHHGRSLFTYGNGWDVGGIYRSDDHGLSWHLHVSLDAGPVTGYAGISNVQVITTNLGQVLTSVDTGRTWILRTVASQIHSLVAYQDHFFITSMPLQRSDSKGENWASLDSSFVIGSSLALLAQGNRLISCGNGEPGAVFISSDDGNQWVDISGNLAGNRTYRLASNTKFLFVGAAGSLWRQPIQSLDVANFNKHIASLSITARGNAIMVHSQPPLGGTHITFEIYDLLGRIAATKTVDSDAVNSEFTLRLNLPIGTYLCKLISKDRVEARPFVMMP